MPQLLEMIASTLFIDGKYLDFSKLTEGRLQNTRGTNEVQNSLTDV